jgi:hypothetical protein
LCFTSFDDCRNLDYNKLTALPANVFAQAPAVVTLYVPEIESSWSAHVSPTIARLRLQDVNNAVGWFVYWFNAKNEAAAISFLVAQKGIIKPY